MTHRAQGGRTCKLAYVAYSTFFHLISKTKTDGEVFQFVMGEVFFSFSILLTHEGLHREVYRDFQPGYDIFRRSGAKG